KAVALGEHVEDSRPDLELTGVFGLRLPARAVHPVGHTLGAPTVLTFVATIRALLTVAGALGTVATPLAAAAAPSPVPDALALAPVLRPGVGRSLGLSLGGRLRRRCGGGVGRSFGAAFHGRGGSRRIPVGLSRPGAGGFVLAAQGGRLSVPVGPR